MKDEVAHHGRIIDPNESENKNLTRQVTYAQKQAPALENVFISLTSQSIRGRPMPRDSHLSDDMTPVENY